MRQVIIYSTLLIAGMVLSQLLPGWLAADFATLKSIIAIATMVCLSFIMIHVGHEFEIDKKKLGSYGVDFVIALTAATLPWLFCTMYFVLVLLPQAEWGRPEAWKESLLAGLFAAPTSAGVLFSMLAAAGLGATWLFRKARILAIFDDLDVVLLMIPMQAMMVGLRWQLAVVVLIMGLLLWLAYRYMKTLSLPMSWWAVLLYSGAIVGASELLYLVTKKFDPSLGVHIEVLLPAFALGCMIKHAVAAHTAHATEPAKLQPAASHPHTSPIEQAFSTGVSALFMLLVGLSMPQVIGAASSPATSGEPLPGYLATHTPALSWGAIALHVVLITVISNLGKMVPALCYRQEAPLRTRLALALGMWPRGEVGAGVLVVSLGYGISGPIVTIAVLSLALNLLLTGLFIVMIKRLLAEPTKS